MLLNEITQYMIDTSLVLPARGLVWVPANGQIVYRKFVGPYVLNKARDPVTGLEMDSYWVNNEHMDLNGLTTNCVWIPTPDEIRDMGAASANLFMSLAMNKANPDQWKSEYMIGLIGYGVTRWEAEFYILDKYLIGKCTT